MGEVSGPSRWTRHEAARGLVRMFVADDFAEVALYGAPDDEPLPDNTDTHDTLEHAVAAVLGVRRVTIFVTAGGSMGVHVIDD